MAQLTVASGCFGKVRSRGDFIRAGDNHQLMSLLDTWAGGGLELLSQNPDWKRLYDEAPDYRFAFLGSRSRLAVCGNLAPSRDASGRRFPLMAASRFEAVDPLEFIARSPLALSGLWSAQGILLRDAVDAEDASEHVGALAAARHRVSNDGLDYEATFEEFLQQQTIGSLERVLDRPGLRLRHTIPALGLLLQPLLSGSGVSVDKALQLPLPADAVYRPLVASFWLDLLSRFVRRGDFELALLMFDNGTSQLLVGFNGADPEILRAAVDPQSGAAHLIPLQDADWVQDYLPTDYGLNKLASYVDRGDLSLKSARAIFAETFLGG